MATKKKTTKRVTRKSSKPKMAIAGVGMVGGALARYLDDPILYDPYKKLGSRDELNSADMVFVAVPTPYDEKRGGFDLSIVEETLANLEGEKIVVIKSTVIPGTTEMLQEKYPNHKILFNPEFLTEITADQDMKFPDRQIVGYTDQSYTVAGDLMQILPQAPLERIMTSTEAEMVKYYGNTWFSVKVIFAEQMFDLCQALGVNYNRIKEGAAADKRIGRSHLAAGHGGYRGYGGKCLPKDTRALIQMAKKLGITMDLLETAEEVNGKLAKSPPIDDALREDDEAFNNNARS